MKKQLNARSIAVMGLLVALTVTLSRLVSFETTFVKVSVAFVPLVIMGIIFGPFWAGMGSVLADLVGMALFAKAAFFIGFTFNAFLEGAIYGIFFYKKKMTWLRAFLAVLTVTVVVNLILTPLWLAIMYKVPLFSWLVWSPRLVKTAVWFPIQTALTYFAGAEIPYQRFLKQPLFKS